MTWTTELLKKEGNIETVTEIFSKTCQLEAAVKSRDLSLSSTCTESERFIRTSNLRTRFFCETDERCCF